MANGDRARAKGLAVVPSTGTSTALVKNGFDEINRTRDMVADVIDSIHPVQPVANGGTGATTPAGARTNLGICGAISYGYTTPTDGTGADGDVYFKYML